MVKGRRRVGVLVNGGLRTRASLALVEAKSPNRLPILLPPPIINPWLQPRDPRLQKSRQTIYTHIFHSLRVCQSSLYVKKSKSHPLLACCTC